MKLFGSLQDVEQCKAAIRTFINELSQANFQLLMDAETPAWSKALHIGGKPSLDDLKGFKSALLTIEASLFKDYPGDEAYQLLVHLLYATNERYLQPITKSNTACVSAPC
ncbi:hypothetical protein FWC63_03215 [Candidatus Saccharibacteria bacterium]|nr:hypothetical protein [Candidatus Saccharibacteria bacterium]